MFEDGRISYPSTPNAWIHTEFTNVDGSGWPLLNTFALALVSTIISYQLTSIVFDLFLGCKARASCRIQTIHTMLLIRKSSPLELLANTIREDILTKLVFKRVIRREAMAEISRDDASVSLPVLSRLFIMLAIAPMMNVLSVFLTMDQRETIMTFEDVGFTGVALDIDPKLINSSKISSEGSQVYPIDFQPGDSSAVEFSTFIRKSHPLRNSDDTSGVVITRHYNAWLTTWVIVDSQWMFMSKTAHMFTGEKAYTLSSTITKESAQAIVDMATPYFKEACQTDDIQERGYWSNNFTQEYFGGFNVTCKNVENPLGLMVTVLHKATRMMTIVESDAFLVANEEDPAEYEDGKKIAFIRRMRRNAPLPALAIIACILVLLRSLVGTLTRNDVQDGIERIIKEKCGVRYCESLLHCVELDIAYVPNLYRRKSRVSSRD